MEPGKRASRLLDKVQECQNFWGKKEDDSPGPGGPVEPTSVYVVACRGLSPHQHGEADAGFLGLVNWCEAGPVPKTEKSEAVRALDLCEIPIWTGSGTFLVSHKPFHHPCQTLDVQVCRCAAVAW